MNTGRLIILIVSVLLLFGCGATTPIVPVPTGQLPDDVYATVAALLDAWQQQDAETVQQLMAPLDGWVNSPYVTREKIHIDPSFWNFESWKVTGATTSLTAPGQRWIVNVELEYGSGLRTPLEIWLAKFEGRWVVTEIPMPLRFNTTQ